MSLVASISGIRGTIGGATGEGLSPLDIVSFTTAYAIQRKARFAGRRLNIVVGRDARISGQMVDRLVTGTLLACGIDVTDIGLASTPTTELAVIREKADGGIILTASHNPMEWNALKLLNEQGEFLDDAEGNEIIRIARAGEFVYPGVEEMGHLTEKDYTQKHIDDVLSYPLVDLKAIRAAGFKAVLDPVNSVGGIIMPRLLEALGVECITINGTPDGHFAHNPEPLPANLVGLSDEVRKQKADIGISVDPDVDRLALICEDGSPFGEEYTLVAAADWFLEHRQGPTVSNLSSSRALRDVTESNGCVYKFSKVGEKNVTTLMHEIGAVIGGEGNGGVIVPDFHCGRDALIGTALILSLLAHRKCSMTQLRATYPPYYISKNKIRTADQALIGRLLDAVHDKFKNERCDTSDGLRVDFEADRRWVVLRKSNTEPIIRIYAEAPTEEAADALAGEVIDIIRANMPE